MSRIRKIKKKLKKSLWGSHGGKIFYYRLHRLREAISKTFTSDRRYLERAFRRHLHRELDLSNPQTFTEKMQWLKLFYRHPDMPRCSDKYEVQNYLRERGYGEQCNEILGVYKDTKEIDYESLPLRFVAKANHGSGWNLICKDKFSLDWKSELRVMKQWLKMNLYILGREWNYETIPPRIVIEKFLEHEPLNDYKVMCFNGKPLYIQLNNDRDGVHYLDFYEIESWKRVPFTYDGYNTSDWTLEKPPLFDRMMEIATDLSKDFPFIRVDFYNYDDVLLIGELTFFPAGGLRQPMPVESGYDLIMGRDLQLPEPNHNLELYHKIMSK